jgi:hypothetical protein
VNGGGVRVGVHDIVDIGVLPPRAARLSLRLSYRAGLDRARTSHLVEPEHEAAVRRLVDVVCHSEGRRVMRWDLAVDVLWPNKGAESVGRSVDGFVDKRSSATLPLEFSVPGAFRCRLNQSGWLADEVVAAGVLEQGKPHSLLSLVTGTALIPVARAALDRAGLERFPVTWDCDPGTGALVELMRRPHG